MIFPRPMAITMRMIWLCLASGHSWDFVACRYRRHLCIAVDVFMKCILGLLSNFQRRLVDESAI